MDEINHPKPNAYLYGRFNPIPATGVMLVKLFYGAKLHKCMEPSHVERAGWVASTPTPIEFFPIRDFRLIWQLPDCKIIIFVNFCGDVK